MVILFVILAAGLILYIFRSIGIMTLAKNRGMSNPWLIWIPVVGLYTLGAITDDINAREGQTSVYRWLLMGGNILSWIFSSYSYVSLFDAMANPYYYYGYGYSGGSGFFGGLVSLAMFILQVIALNKIFKCYKPYSATTYTVLCAIPFTAFMQSIFPFTIRNNQPNWINPPHQGGWQPPQGGYDPYGQQQGQQWQAPPPQGGWQPPPDDRYPPQGGDGQ